MEGIGVAGHHARSWTVATSTLMKAKTWIFVGYSLPLADENAKWLLGTAAGYRKWKKDLPQVFIVDWVKNPDEEKRKKAFDDNNIVKTLTPYGFDLKLEDFFVGGFTKNVVEQIKRKVKKP